MLMLELNVNWIICSPINQIDVTPAICKRNKKKQKKSKVLVELDNELFFKIFLTYLITVEIDIFVILDNNKLPIRVVIYFLWDKGVSVGVGWVLFHFQKGLSRVDEPLTSYTKDYLLLAMIMFDGIQRVELSFFKLSTKIGFNHNPRSNRKTAYYCKKQRCDTRYWIIITHF